MGLSDILRADFEEALREHPESVRDTLDEMHPADIAELLLQLEHEVQAKVIPQVPEDKAAEVIDYLGTGNRAPVFTLLAPELQVKVAENMSADDRADMFAALDEETREAVLSRLPKSEATDVATLMKYPPNTAGSLMTTDIVPVPVDLTIGETLERVRVIAEEMETITYVYLTDKPTGRLMGVLSLRELVLNRPNRPVSEVMNDNVITVGPLTDQEEVAKTIAKYDLVALPVVDDNHKLLGIVTVDDMVDVVVAEGTEDIHKLGGMQASEAPYFATPFQSLFRKRAGWLVVLLFGQMLTVSALQHYDSVLQSVKGLVWFIPMIVSSGGNSGSQTATLLVRGMAVGEIHLTDWLRVLIRESWMGLSLGLLLGVFGVLRVLFITGDAGIAVAVGFSLVGVVVFGCLTATALPLLLRKMGLDPAVSSAPFIASLVDVTGIVIYVNVALFVLAHLLPQVAK